MSIKISISPDEIEFAENTARMLMADGYSEEEALELAIKDIKYTIKDQNGSTENPQ